MQAGQRAALHLRGYQTPGSKSLKIIVGHSAALSHAAVHLGLVSNDRLVIWRDLTGMHMHGIAKYPRVNPGALINQPAVSHLLSNDQQARYRLMGSDELRSVEDKHDVLVESTLVVAFTLAAPLHSFIALDWDHRASQKTSLVDIDPFQRPDLIDDVMKSAGVMLPPAAVRRRHQSELTILI